MRLTIQTVDGPERRECIALRNGCAITRAPDGEEGWTITHVRTGHRINCLSLLTLRQARVAFALVTSLGPWDDFRAGVAPPACVYDALCSIAEMVESR